LECAMFGLGIFGWIVLGLVGFFLFSTLTAAA
jgi:hypothetical protein